MLLRRAVILLLFLAATVRPLPATGAVALDTDRGRVNIAPHLEMLEDPGGGLNRADVSSARFQGRWRENTHPSLHVGHTASAWWFRFKLQKPPPADESDWFIEFNKPGIANIDLHIPVGEPGTSGDEEWLVRRTGAARPVESRDVRFRTYVIKLPQDFRAGDYFYIRIETIISMNMMVYAWTPESLAERVWQDYLGFGLVFGVLIAMLMYNLVIGLFLGDRVYFVYVLYILGLLLNQFFLFGHAHLFLPLSVDAHQTALWAVVGNSWFWAGAFTRNFLRLHQYSRRMDRLVLAIMGISLLMIVFGLIGWGRAANILSNLLSAAAPFMGIAAGIISLRRGYSPARYYLLGWGLIVVGLALYVMGGVVIERSFVTVYFWVAASAVEAILLSLALADRIRVLRLEKEHLEKQERRLTELSMRDDLTGLYNRRYLMGKVAGEVETAHRLDRPLSLLMVDVDRFKDYNDTHGHPEGDKVLMRLAEIMQADARRSDTACRYGGEEFTLLLPGSDLDEAATVAERIRREMAAAVFHPDGGAARVTISIGAARLENGESADDLLIRADAALYRAKQSGRNTVVASHSQD